jgi:hypothetical protein
MKNIRELDPMFRPRRYRTLEDAEKDQNAIYPLSYDGEMTYVSREYEEAQFEEDILLTDEFVSERVTKAR